MLIINGTEICYMVGTYQPKKLKIQNNQQI